MSNCETVGIEWTNYLYLSINQLCPSSRTIWERALVGSQRSRQARRPPTPPQSTSQIRPGRAAHDPMGGINERVRAHTRTCNRRLQTTTIRSETSKRMQQENEGAAQRPFFRHTDMRPSVSNASKFPVRFRFRFQPGTGPLQRVLPHQNPIRCNWASFTTKNPPFQPHNFGPN